MASYVVLERTGGRDVEIVRDGFRWLAFLVPIFWFAFHRMWRETLAVVAVGAALAAFPAFGILPALAGALAFAVALLAGMEAANLRIAGLRRTGWQEVAALDARSEADAEIRYFGNLPEIAERPAPGLYDGPSERAAAPRPGTPALGFFSYPGQR